MRSALIFLFLWSVWTLNGQSFSPLPSSVLEREVLPDAANECYLYFDDFSSDTLHLKWRLGSADMPEGWNISLCDYGTCYEGIPGGKTMLPAPDTIRPYLKLLVQPGAVSGSAWVWFRVFNVQDESDFQDVYFSLFTPGITGTAPETTSKTARFYPNPVREELHLSGGQGAARIFTAHGCLMWQGGENESTIHVTNWPSGIYYIQQGNQKSLLLKQ